MNTNKIEFDTVLDDKPLKVTVRKPSVAAREKAKLVDARAFREAVEAGAFRKNQLKSPHSAEQVQQILELQDRLAKNGRKVPDEKGKVRDKGVTKAQAQEAAVQMRFDRFQLRQLNSGWVEDESRTAESIARNAAFDYLVSACSLKENGDPVFESVDDYKERSNRGEKIADECAIRFALLDQGMDPDWEKNLPEVKYLESVKYFQDAAPEAEEVFDLQEEPAETPAAPPEPTPTPPETPNP